MTEQIVGITQGIAIALSVIALSALAVPVSADTVNARCDIYPKGVDHASGSIPCTFSQRQGYIRIEREDSISHDLSPAGDTPGNYVDQSGHRVYPLLTGDIIQ